MKVLWLTNIPLPEVASRLGIKASNKEGWLSGICSTVKKSHDFELSIAFPVPMEKDGFFEEIDGIKYYGFFENTAHPESYDASIEERLNKIYNAVCPDVVHIFGTEYPHTLSMCRVVPDKDKLLIGIQGILEIYKDHYFDGLPEYVINRVTFRDLLRHDSLKIQREKYALRAINEVEAVKLTGNVTGRTPFDYDFCRDVNPNVNYYFMNETLRSNFYTGTWDRAAIEPHSIFLSQGNYPIKGLHVMLEALFDILKVFPDVKIYVAGDNVTKHASFSEKLKLSSYGKYILELIKKMNLEDRVCFLGSLNSDQMKDRLLKSELFVCPSSIENSPNSLGEAMLLGVPCIASDVGGIRGIFEEDVDGLMFKNMDSKGLAEAVIRMLSNVELEEKMSGNAKVHARITHDPKNNYQRLMEIYSKICK